MCGLGLKDGLKAAAKADFISLTSLRSTVRLDGGHGVRSLSGTAPADAELGRVLAAHAGRHERVP